MSNMQNVISPLRYSLGCIFIFSLFCTQLNAQEASENYANHEKAKAFAAYMLSEHEYDEGRIRTLLTSAEKKQSILDAIARPAEKRLQWHEYRKIFLGNTRVEQGVAFWNAHAITLKEAAQHFGIPEEIILAILGVETRYGKHAGSYRVIDALSTLAFDYPPRSKFFTKELENFLLLVRDQELDPLALKGSYAGAMGYGQFMPSSYRAYAYDFDGDGTIDIWQNAKDAIGSVANYLKKHRWQTGEPVVVRARIADGYDKTLINQKIKPELTLNYLKGSGYTPVDPGFDEKKPAMVLQYHGEHGKEFWIGFNNFYVITRYNRSQLYAMAVWQLSQEIKKLYEQESRKLEQKAYKQKLEQLGNNS